LNNAVNYAIEAGLPIVVAAGNTNSAACVTSPASAEKAITVGAIDDRYDSIASFSNWGKCVTVFAPGVYVTSLAKFGNATLAMSGTSMASPSVTGTLAMFMGLGDTAADAIGKLTSIATEGAIDTMSLFFRPFSPNLVAFNGFMQSVPLQEAPEPKFHKVHTLFSMLRPRTMLDSPLDIY
jgi:subtilase-type proteinase RRT12